MRDLILAMNTSLDGFVSGPNGEVEWMFSGDEEAVAWKVSTLESASLLIMGSRTFRDMAPYWPGRADAFAGPMNRIPKAVFSRQGKAVLDCAAEGDWPDAYVAGGDLREEVARMKAGDGGPVIALGGGAFARSLLAAGLADQLMLGVHPIALGQGVPLYSDLARPMRLELTSARAFPKGALALTYRRPYFSAGSRYLPLISSSLGM